MSSSKLTQFDTLLFGLKHPQHAISPLQNSPLHKSPFRFCPKINRPGLNRHSFNRPISQFAPFRIVLNYKNKKFGFLRREQGRQELVVEQLSADQAPPRQRRGDELRTERMLEVTKRYDADVVGFLHDMAANLEINL